MYYMYYMYYMYPVYISIYFYVSMLYNLLIYIIY